MAADQRRTCRSGEDRISSLPDELLHDVLVRLGCARAAVRTSVLSRRWRHVWAHLPELLLEQPRRRATTTSSSFLDAVDAALGRYSAPTLERLTISLSSVCDTEIIQASRIAPWLSFAAERGVSELCLSVSQWFVEGTVLELPACELAKIIELSFTFARGLRLIPASSLFAALTSLKIRHLCMDGGDLTALVCTQCPCLRVLDLFLKLITSSDVTVHSNSLHTLVLGVPDIRRLEIVAPRLEDLTVRHKPMEAHISAPKLIEVSWQAAYDAQVHHLIDVGRALRLLKTSNWSSSLAKRFDEVDELELEVDLRFEARYESFWNETNKLPKCKTFDIALHRKDHALVPVLLHLWRSCNGTKKFTVHVFDAPSQPWLPPSFPWSCLCRFEEGRKINGIDLSSLEEVEIKGFKHSHEQMELLEFLSSYKAGILKRLVIISASLSPTPKEIREKVRSMCHTNVKVEFGEGRPLLPPSLSR